MHSQKTRSFHYLCLFSNLWTSHKIKILTLKRIQENNIQLNGLDERKKLRYLRDTLYVVTYLLSLWKML